MVLRNTQLHCFRARVIVIFLCLLFLQPILWGLVKSCVAPQNWCLLKDQQMLPNVFNHFNQGLSWLKKLINQTNQKRFFPKRTRKNPTNPTNQKWLVPIEHDHSILSLKQVILLNVLNFLLLIFSVVLQISLGADVMPMLMSV